MTATTDPARAHRPSIPTQRQGSGADKSRHRAPLTRFSGLRHRFGHLTDTPVITVISAVLFIVLIGIVLATFQDYGIGWDEDTNLAYGDAVVAWYRSFFQDGSALFFPSGYMHLYGGFYELVAHIIGPLLPLGLYQGRHLIIAVFGLVGVAYTYRLGQRFAGPLGGLFSAGLLVLTPVFYGHLFMNPKDIPFAALCQMALFYLVRGCQELPRLSRGTCLKLGVSIGLATGVRVGGLLYIGYLVIAVAAWIALNRAAVTRARWPTAGLLGVSVALSVAVAWVVMLVCWPWTQMSPFVRPIEAALLVTHFIWTGSVLFNGETINATHGVPPSYLPTWLSVTLPEFYPVALFAGAVLATKSLLRWRAHAETARPGNLLEIGLVALAAFTPLAIAVILQVQAYDGIRQFIFILPPLAVLAGFSVTGLIRANELPAARYAVVAVIAGLALLTLWDMKQLHPYEYVYFNRLIAGGEKTASQRFDTDYWSLSYKEAIDWVLKNYMLSPGSPVTVDNCSKPSLTKYYLDQAGAGSRFVQKQPGQRTQIFLATTRFHCNELQPGEVLHIVERQGTPLTYVIQVPPEQPAAPGRG